MPQIIKRIFLLVVLSFLTLNSILFFVLNSPIIKDKIVDYANKKILSQHGLALTLDSVSFNFFPAALNLNEVLLQEINYKKNADFRLSLNQITVGIDMVSSYFYRKPVFKNTILRGIKIDLRYDANGALILPDIFKKKSNEPVDMPEIFSLIFPYLPSQLSLLNATVTIGENKNDNFQYVNLSSLSLTRNKNKNDIFYKFKILSHGSMLSVPSVSKKVKLMILSSDGELRQNGKINFNHFNIDSNILSLDSSMVVLFKKNFLTSSYYLNVNSLDIYAHDFFSFLKINAQNGLIHLSGVVKPESDSSLTPFFLGAAQWKNVDLEGFSLYSGKANVSFSKKTITYRQAFISTPAGGELTAEGKFELFDHYRFENTAKINKFSFFELLHGLGVPASPVDFNFNSNSVLVKGFISSPRYQKSFEMSVLGSINANHIDIKPFSNLKRQPLPTSNIAINLKVNDNKIQLGGTNIFIPTKYSKGLVTIPQGYIDVSSGARSGQVNIDLDGHDLDLSAASYFLPVTSRGRVDFQGNVSVLPRSNQIVFVASTVAKQGEILGVQFQSVKGQIQIDTQGVSLHNVTIQAQGNQAESSQILVKSFRLNFKDLLSQAEVSVVGKLGVLVDSISYWLPPELHGIRSDIDHFEFKLKGPFFEPKKWDVNLDSQFIDFEFLNAHIEDFNLVLNCQNGVCQKSYFALQGVNPVSGQAEGQGNLVNKHFYRYSYNPQTMSGKFIVDLEYFSQENMVIRAQANQFPLSVLSSSRSKISGSLNGYADLSGRWGNLQGTLTSYVKDLSINSRNLGNFMATILPETDAGITFDVVGYQSQMSSKLFIPYKFLEPSKLDVVLRNFNITSFLPPEFIASHNIFSQLSGQFHFESLRNKDDFLSLFDFYRWHGSGYFSYGLLQFENLQFDFKETSQLVLENGILHLPHLEFSNHNSHFSLYGSANLEKKKLSLTGKIKADLAGLNEAFPKLFTDKTKGFIGAQVTLAGPFERLNIEGDLEAESPLVALKSFGPDITNLKGKIIFHDRIVEIQRFTAAKGKGEISLAGRIDFSHQEPDYTLSISGRRAEFRIPLPIFDFADVKLDTELTLKGQKPPYKIEGDVNILNFQIFRDLTCAKISSGILHMTRRDSTIVTSPFAFLDVNIHSMDAINIQSRCLRGKFSIAPGIAVTGDTVTPSFQGSVVAEGALLQLLKTQFDVKKAYIHFSEEHQFDPILDVQLQGRVNTYNILANVNGQASLARVELSADPPMLPNGDRITESDIISMVSTGQVPSESSNANLLSASSGVASFLGINNFLETALNQTVSSVTGGIIDNISISPNSQNGQVSLRINASRALSERFALGVSYEEGQAGAARSAYSSYYFNETVSAVSSYNYQNFIQQQPTSELYGGLKFQFGSQ